MNVLKVLKKTKKIEPVSPQERYKCPFYGFHYVDNGINRFMAEQGGNECALSQGEYSPCPVKVDDGEIPDWNKCPINNEKNRKIIEDIIKYFKVFPKEFRPEGVKHWKGIPMSRWFEYVTNQEWMDYMANSS